MIEKTGDDGFMARHILHWPKPDYPDYASFRKRVEAIDDDEKMLFLSKILGIWTDLGNARKETVTR